MTSRARSSLWLCGAALLLPACSSYVPDMALRDAVERADYSTARARLESDIAKGKDREREYVLDNMRLAMVDLAAGNPESAEPPAFQTFFTLRRQGINDDQTVAATFLGEGGTIFWKGEPFEQALAFTYTAVNYAELGQWDNTRAASQASLFQLKNFGDAERGENKGHHKTKEDIAEEAARREQQHKGAYENYIDHGYTPVKTNFAYGYLLAALANFALSADRDRLAESQDNFREAAALNPALHDVADRVLGGNANVILVLDYGRGPEKIRYGPDGSLSRFMPRTPSDSRRAVVQVAGGSPQFFSFACDVNQMSQDHMWNSFEDVRHAKSVIGDVLLAGGLITAGTGLNRNTSKERTEQGLVGLGIALAGVALKSSAAADLRHNEILPQRTYVIPIHLDSRSTSVRVSIEGDPTATIDVTDVAPPPPGEKLALHYIRLSASGVPYPAPPPRRKHSRAPDPGRHFGFVEEVR